MQGNECHRRYGIPSQSPLHLEFRPIHLAPVSSLLLAQFSSAPSMMRSWGPRYDFGYRAFGPPTDHINIYQLFNWWSVENWLLVFSENLVRSCQEIGWNWDIQSPAGMATIPTPLGWSSKASRFPSKDRDRSATCRLNEEVGRISDVSHKTAWKNCLESVDVRFFHVSKKSVHKSKKR